MSNMVDINGAAPVSPVCEQFRWLEKGSVNPSHYQIICAKQHVFITNTALVPHKRQNNG